MFFSLRGRSLFISIYQLGGGGPNQISIFEVDPPPQQQTVCNADPSTPPPMAPSPLLSQQIITLAIPNCFQNVIKHKINKKRWDNDNQERKKK